MEDRERRCEEDIEKDYTRSMTGDLHGWHQCGRGSRVVVGVWRGGVREEEVVS